MRRLHPAGLCLGAALLFSGCGDEPLDAGVEELEFAGAPLDGSMDAELAIEAAKAELAERQAAEANAAAAGEEQALAADVLEGEDDSSASGPVQPTEDEIQAAIAQVASELGLTVEEARNMANLPEDVLRDLAAARIADQAAGNSPREPEKLEDGTLGIRFRHLSLDELDDFELEDLMDSLLYPEEYSEEERKFPEQIAKLDGKQVVISGYMIPVDWKGGDVIEFMLVRDLLACCFGGAPQPDEWINVEMVEGAGTKYHAYIPILCKGKLFIGGIEDDAGYAAGCFNMLCESVSKE